MTGLLVLLACTPAVDDPEKPAPTDTSTVTPVDSASPESAPVDSGTDPVDSGDSGSTTEPVDTTPETIRADDPHLQYMGRIVATDPEAPGFYWAGSAVRARFEGTSLKIHLDDAGTNWVNVLIDDLEPQVIACTPGAATYVVAEGLEDGVHTVEINKRTEPAEGVLAFRGFELDPGAGLVDPPERPALRMEYYGDSITSGYSIDCACDLADAVYKDNYHTYAGLTARALGAEYHSISISGIGLVRSWWYATMYDYWDSVQDIDHAWDFTSWQADIVVINLGQNDYWLGVRAPITLAYVDFAREVRARYPDAEIFLALGSMDAVAPGSPYPGYLEAAVAQLNETDPDVHAVLFDYNGTGTHPVAADHVVMSDTLVAAIRAAMPELP